MPKKRKSSDTDAKFPVTDADWEALLTAAPDSVDDPDTRLIDGSNAILTPGGGVEATLNALRRNRGPQRAATKQPVNVRLSPEVLAGFRATGKGWQTRLDAALKEWISQQPSGTQERQ
jgi:uncharacterized protein (DUF4415 family)